MPEPIFSAAGAPIEWQCPNCLWEFAPVATPVEAHRAFEEHWSLSHALSRWQCDECGGILDDSPGDHDGDLCADCYGGLLRKVPDA